MNKNIALMIAGIVFTLVAVLHLLRIFFHVEVLFAGTIIPMWPSWAGFIVAAILAAIMFIARRD